MTIIIVSYINSLLSICAREGGDIDRETAIASMRSYLGASIEIKAIPDKEVEKLSFYFSGDRRDYYFFYYRGNWEMLGVGGSNCVAVSKKTGKLAYVEMVEE